MDGLLSDVRLGKKSPLELKIHGKSGSTSECVDFLSMEKQKSIVRQSNIQLTCYSYRRNCDKPRLRCSLLNCNYTLQVLPTNDYKQNGRCITQIAKHECASVHIVKQQTATFQTYGPGSVHLYATHDILTCNVHTDVYNLDLRILNIYTCVGKLILH